MEIKLNLQGRRGGSRRLEWYRANVNPDGSLCVTFNSHHSNLFAEDSHNVFHSKSNKRLDKKQAQALRESVAKMQQEREQKQKEKEEDR